MAEIIEVTQINGTGPFGNHGARRIFVTPVIRGWMDRPSKLWNPESIMHDLFVMGQFPWRGLRRIGGIPFSNSSLMDRMERLQVADPRMRLFTGVFPRLQGQNRKQVVWWVPLEGRTIPFGTEEEISLLGEPLECRCSGLPDPHAGGRWTGLSGLGGIDWSACFESAPHPDRHKGE